MKKGQQQNLQKHLCHSSTTTFIQNVKPKQTSKVLGIITSVKLQLRFIMEDIQLITVVKNSAHLKVEDLTLAEFGSPSKTMPTK